VKNSDPAVAVVQAHNGWCRAFAGDNVSENPGIPHDLRMSPKAEPMTRRTAMEKWMRHAGDNTFNGAMIRDRTAGPVVAQ